MNKSKVDKNKDKDKNEDHNLHPHWVVVQNPNRQPIKQKYVFGYKSHSDAENERQRRQEIEDERVKEATVRRIEQNKQRVSIGLAELKPVVRFVFSVIKRPPTGYLG